MQVSIFCAVEYLFENNTQFIPTTGNTYADPVRVCVVVVRYALGSGEGYEAAIGAWT